MTEPAAPPADERRPVVGALVGGASLLAGALLLALWMQQRIAPSLMHVPVVPFFDTMARWDRPGAFIVAHGLAGLALLLTGLAMLRRMRFAPPLFAVCGWGGFALTIASWIPRANLLDKVQFALKNAIRLGAVPRGATAWDLVPQQYVVIAVIFLVVWIAMLLVGTLHLFRNRSLYAR